MGTSWDWSTCRRWRPTRARPPPSNTRDSPRRLTSSSTSSRTDIGFLNHDKFKAGFAADASDADAAFLRDTQVPINMSVFETPVKNAAWRDKPSWAVIATEDKSFDQAMLQHMAKRIGAKITNVSASHALFITQSGVVSDVIVTAAQNAAGSAR